MLNHAKRPSIEFDMARIDAIFAHLDQGRRPGAAVGIAIDGRTVYRKGFGVASMNLPLLLSPTMRIRIGSVTKQFAAFAYMLLCEEGLAGIDDAIGKHLPELNAVTHRATMRQLMGNNSGLRDATDFIMQFSGVERGRITTSDVMAFYRESSEVNFAPGLTHIYNNGGWVILSEVIERITKSSLEEVLRDRVFDPIRMYDTLVHRWEAEYVPNSAGSHALNEDGKYEWTEPLGGVDYAGAGAMMTTVDDMLRWMAHMDRPTVGNAETWRLMKDPQVLASISSNYGLGLNNEICRGVRMIHHGGGGHGSTTQMVKVPEAALDVIVMCNWQDNRGIEASAAGLADRILEACLPDLQPEDGSRYEGPFPEGVFRSPKTGRAIQCLRTATVYRSADNTPVVAMDGHLTPFTPDSEGVLRPSNAVFPGYALTPVGPLTEPTAFKLQDFDISDELVRVHDIVGSEAALTNIVGRYHCDETNTDAIIQATEWGPRFRTDGKFGSAEHTLEYLADGVWRNRILNRWILPTYGFLLFDANGRDFGFYNYLTRNVRFKRVG